jgi:hypothetical protein
MLGADAGSDYVVKSRWAETPPTIDGFFSAGEWTCAQIPDLPPQFLWEVSTFVYFMNDLHNLYVCVDAVGDTSFEGLDVVFLQTRNPCNLFRNYFVVYGSNELLVSDFVASARYGPSPNSDAPHMIFELKIPLSLMSNGTCPVLPCSTVFLWGVPIPGDYNQGQSRVNHWPISAGEAYGEILLACPPVGGQLASSASPIPLIAVGISVIITALASKKRLR